MNISCRCREGRRWQPIALLAFLAASAAQVQFVNAALAGWKIEQGVEIPSYAAVEPTTTNLNIDTVVLACEEMQKSRVLQLQLYLSDDGPLRPRGAPLAMLKDDPRATIFIDAHEFPVALLFADDHAVLADRREGRFPLLSDRLVDALQTDQRMILHFDLVAEPPGHPASFDGEATVDLQAVGAREAIAAMRRCAGSAGHATRSSPPEEHHGLPVSRGHNGAETRSRKLGAAIETLG